MQGPQEIGAWGPVVLNSGNNSGTYYFSTEDNPEAKIDAQIIQSTNQLFAYPIIPLEISKSYQLNETGNPKAVTKKISVREPCVAYIEGQNGKSEIWKKCPGQESVQISKTNRKVKDFTVSRSGDWLFLTVDSDSKGSEIWQLSPDGTIQKKIFECLESECSDLNYSPLTSKLAFVEVNNKTKIKILDILTRKTDDHVGSGTELKFSPDGQYLSYFDILSEQLIILNLSTQKKIFKQSGAGLVGEWARNSHTILYGEFEFWGGIPGVIVYELEVDSGEERTILFDPNHELEFYQPMYSSDEGVLLTSIRQRGTGPSKQLWLIKEGAEEIKQITNDPLYHYSFPSWNSDYSELVFQRYPLNTSDGHPQVVIWNRSQDSFQVIAENASKPFWLP
jgi:WD40 repeat protein